MNAAWLEAAMLTLAAVGAGAAGAWMGRQTWRGWVPAYTLGLGLILLAAAGRRWDALGTAPALAWLMAGRTEFAAVALAIPLLLMTHYRRLPRRRDQIAVLALMVTATAAFLGGGFVAPALTPTLLAGHTTDVDPLGVCHQTTGFTCGPASAVTVLRRLGVAAGEAELATAARTSALFGTEPEALQGALLDRFGAAGLHCEPRRFRDLADLAATPAAITIVRHNFWVHHYVAVLSVRDGVVEVGDPLGGRTTYTAAAFARVWRRSGLVLWRTAPPLPARHLGFWRSRGRVET